MLFILSPAKLLNTNPPPPELPITPPRFLEQTRALHKAARRLSVSQWQSLTGISQDLAQRNHDRFAAMQLDTDAHAVKQAVLAFNGDVYRGLEASSLKDKDLTWAQDHVRILSGLYGLLRPLDGIEPYRLEMGTRLKVGTTHTLYDFWDTRLAQSLDQEAQGRPILNLASNEYIRAAQPKSMNLPMIDCVFHEIKDGQARPLFMYTKRARGLMCRFAILERIEDPRNLHDFCAENYRFDAQASSPTRLVFSRPQPVPKNIAIKTRRRAASDH